SSRQPGFPINTHRPAYPARQGLLARQVLRQSPEVVIAPRDNEYVVGFNRVGDGSPEYDAVTPDGCHDADAKPVLEVQFAYCLADQRPGNSQLVDAHVATDAEVVHHVRNGDLMGETDGHLVLRED